MTSSELPTSLRVARHPGIASPSTVDVLRAGFAGIDRAHDSFLATKVECLEGTTPEAGLSLGAGWLISTNIGLAFVPERGPNELLKPVKFQAFGNDFEAAALAIDFVSFEDRLNGMLDVIVAIPYADIVESGCFVRKSLFKQSTYLMLGCEDQAGNRRDYLMKAGKDYFSLTHQYFDKRWEQEMAALTIEVVDSAVGGLAFWVELEQKLRDAGLRSAPVDKSLKISDVMRTAANMPRILDGPTDTRTFIEQETELKLKLAGFVQTRALAAMYLYENGYDAIVANPVDPYARSEAWKDQKFMAALLDRWQPSHQAYRATFEPLRGTRHEYTAMDMVEKAALDEHLG